MPVERGGGRESEGEGRERERGGERRRDIKIIIRIYPHSSVTIDMYVYETRCAPN